ncbi:extended synaptotagmin-1 isoform X1 [Astyanax mexicanus]|uniref:extended synaptotagmin-1 isoform X1 n=2 Tax=Astyanax mexicanus TaxID=7994 RepID=UPI0020CADCAC|nr:extended synaptotagmin-1 isoform X1 [Astyanax mexicanus]
MAETLSEPGSSSEEAPAAEEAPSPGDSVERSRRVDPMAVLWTFGKCLTALLPVYLAGYYRVSTSLVVFGLVVYSGWKHTREAKEARLRAAMQAVCEEHGRVSLRGAESKRDLPTWVNFPDVEKVEWLNKVLQQAWPFIGQYLEKLLTETIAPSIRASSAHLQTLCFTKIDFGDKAIKVVGVKAHRENEKGQVLLDVYISYVGNVEINVEVKRYFCKAGVKGIQLNGMMRVILEPLIGDIPIVGAVTMFFIRRPKLSINWSGLTNLLDIPGLNVMSDTMIMDAIASYLVLPNRLTVALVPDLHVAQLRSPLPRGVVRIYLLEADNLAEKDSYMKGVIAGKSDPYALIRVGPQTFKSRHQDNTLSPKWGEMYEVIVHEVPGQELEVEVYDKDPDQDDFLGRIKIDLGIVRKAKVIDEWFTLKDVKTGQVHLKLEWLTLEDNTENLEQVLKKNETFLSKTAVPPSAAILTVYLDKAEGLPMKKGNKDPSPKVQISLQDVMRESKTCWNTVNPQWEDAFMFFIQNPLKQDIDIEVRDNDNVQTLGSLSIPLSRLLSSSQLSLNEWFKLTQSGPDSRIHINTVLRVLWMDESAISSSLLASDQDSLTSKCRASRPKHTSPDPSFATEGVLRIHLLKGQNLVPKDNMMGGMVKGKSDPYITINVGGNTFKSNVIKENLNPLWNEMYEVVLTDLPGQDISLEVLDRDMDMKDDFMGRLKIKLTDIVKAKHIDELFALNDVKHGSVHLALEWLPTVTQPDKLEKVLHYQAKSSYLNKAVPAVALLFIYLDSAHDLPLKKSGKEPKVGAELVLGGTSHKTLVCDRSSSPKWNEAFHFLLKDPWKEELMVKLSHCWDFSLGSVVIPVRELLCQPDLLLDQWLNLDGASPGSQILLRAQLKILCPKVISENYGEHTETPASPTTSVQKTKPAKDLTQKSSELLVPVTVTSPVITLEEIKCEETPDALMVTSEADIRHTTPDPRFATEGVLRIHLLEAKNLIAKDNLMGGIVKGKSDPYVKISVEGTTFQSHVIKENLNPTWNEMYELVVASEPSSEILVQVFDKDIDKDDFLGRVHISLKEIIQTHYCDQWFSLNDVKHGCIHLVLEWVSTVTQPEKLQQALQLQSVHTFQNKALPSVALLFILIERAKALPKEKGGKEPKAGAELFLGVTSYKTKVCDRSTSPQWGEAFHFLLHNPNEDNLIIKIQSRWEEPLGSLVLPARELLSKPELLLDQWQSLNGAGPESQILLRAQLKILASMMDRNVTKPIEKHIEKPIEKHSDKPAENPAGADILMGGRGEERLQSTPATSQEIKPTPRLNELVVSTVRVAVTHPEEKQSPAADDSNKVLPCVSTVEGDREEPITASQSESKDKIEQEHSDKTTEHTVPVKPPTAEEMKEATTSRYSLPQHTNPDPSFGTQGVLRIHLLEAQNLVAMDSLMGGMVKGKSDPYVKISVGGTTLKSHVIKENLNPTWNEMYEMILSVDPNLEVKFELYDKDIDSDDFLGRLKIKLGDIIRFQYHDEWYNLSDVKHGNLHLVLEWVPTVTQPEKFQQVLQMQNSLSYQNKASPSAALLSILIERAKALPLKKSGKEPKAGAELTLGGTSYKTKVCDRTTSPQWHEAFNFLIHDPSKDMLVIKLSSGWDQPMGFLVLPLKELISKPELLLDQWLSLDGALPESQILLRAQLKVLNSKMAALVAMGAGPVLSNKQAATTGQIRLSLSYQKKLTVVVHACRSLVTASKEGLDTYVSLILLPDKNKATKRKTAVKKKDLDPEFNERFEFDLSADEARERVLSVCLKHSVSFMARDKDVIGQVQIDLAQVDFHSGVTKWFDLKENNN